MTSSTAPVRAPIGPRARLRRTGGRGIKGRQGAAGWLFVTPVLVILGLFLLIPIGMAVWVSLTSWNGNGSPFASGVPFTGLHNYASLFTTDGLVRQDFMTSIRNIFYYVLLVVPLQTALALGLALAVNQQRLKGTAFFRTAFYFPSVTSSVAITLVFLFLFTGNGTINALLSLVGLHGPQWFADSNGVLQMILAKLHLVNMDNPPSALVNHGFLSLSWWDWLAGPSVAMCAIIALVVWTTSGTFMLMFLAALQDIPVELEEATMLDGANGFQRLRSLTLPMLKPTMFLVITLGLIGTWQVFDQIYVGTQGGPAKTTLSPAYVSYSYGFGNNDWGPAAAMSFVLFAIIIFFTLLQRFFMRDRSDAKARRAARRARRREGVTA